MINHQARTTIMAPALNHKYSFSITTYIVYVVYEPDVVEDGDAIEIETVATAEYIWDEDNCETLMIDPAGKVYLITKVMI